MQRLARIPLDSYQSESIDLFHHYDEIITILNRYLPPSVATLFAQPEVKGEMVEWYSNLQGQPHLLSASEKIAEVETEITRRFKTIDGLRQQLIQDNAISQSQAILLEKLVNLDTRTEKQIYLINGEPVLIGWGNGTLLNNPVNSAVAANVPEIKRKGFPLWCGLLALLLLILLGVLGYWFYTQKNAIEESKQIVPPTEKTEITTAPLNQAPKPEALPLVETAETEPEVAQESEAREEPKVEQSASLVDTPPVTTKATEPVKKDSATFNKPPANKKKTVPKLDAITEKVRKNGGNPDGDFRASLAWYNGEDLDLQLNTLKASNSCRNSYAVLDVDTNGVGCGNQKRNFTSPVENIVAVNQQKMPNGTYIFSVEQYGAHLVPGGYSCKFLDNNPGFELQIKLNNRLITYKHKKPIRQCLKPIKMVEIKKQGNQFKIVNVNPNLKLISDVDLSNQ